MRYFLVLGSNLGNREKNLHLALKRIQESGLSVLKTSSVYESEPVEVKAQPWFLNQAIEIESGVSPPDLLSLLKRIEKKMGRREKEKKESREIDIDIILAEEKEWKTEELIIPHPRLHLRKFVLMPLNEIAPDACHPLFKKKISELLKRVRDRSLVKIWRPHAQKD